MRSPMGPATAAIAASSARRGVRVAGSGHGTSGGRPTVGAAIGVGCSGAGESESNATMKTSLDHLPSPKRRELARVVEIVHEEIADAQALAGDRKRRDRLLKVVLFGSYTKRR